MLNEQRANLQQTKKWNNLIKTDHIIFFLHLSQTHPIIIVTVAECELCLVLEIFVDRYGVSNSEEYQASKTKSSSALIYTFLNQSCPCTVP